MVTRFKLLAGAIALAFAPVAAFAVEATCTVPDSQPTVVVGEVVTSVPNVIVDGGCSINDLILEQGENGAGWGGHGDFVRHVGAVTLDLLRSNVVRFSQRKEIIQAAKTSSVGNTLAVKLIGFNDFHGNLESDLTQSGIPAGNADWFAAYIDSLRAKNPNHAVVSAGDLIGASPLVSALIYDEPTIEVMNRIAIDFNAVGNHEFDEGRDELLRMQSGGCHPAPAQGYLTCQGATVGTPAPFEGAQFKFLAANVVDQATGRTLFPAYGVKDFKGNRIAFIGMTLEGTPSIVTPAGVAGLSFQDEADTVNALIPLLKARGIEAIVVVIHEGMTYSGDLNACAGASGPLLDIVSRLDDAVDLVISGHTHTAYNCQLPNSVGRNILATSAGSFSRVLTEIDLTLDNTTHDIVAASATNLIVDRNNTAIVPRADITSLVTAYKNLTAPLANTTIGMISADITRTANAGGESAAGDMIADAQLDATNDAGFGDAVVAFMNPGGIRADFLFAQNAADGHEEGDGVVTYGEAFTVQPFGNSLVTKTFTGQQIYDLLEQQWSSLQTFARILQVSTGFTYQHSFNLAGDFNAQKGGQYVCDGSVKLNGVAIDKAASYRVTMNSFLATGGDNFSVFNAGTDNLGGAQDLDALSALFVAQGTIDPQPIASMPRIEYVVSCAP